MLVWQNVSSHSSRLAMHGLQRPHIRTLVPKTIPEHGLCKQALWVPDGSTKEMWDDLGPKLIHRSAYCFGGRKPDQMLHTLAGYICESNIEA